MLVRTAVLAHCASPERALRGVFSPDELVDCSHRLLAANWPFAAHASGAEASVEALSGAPSHQTGPSLPWRRIWSLCRRIWGRQIKLAWGEEQPGGRLPCLAGRTRQSTQMVDALAVFAAADESLC